uniref:Uncharacterized protein n=1 Tax=Rangifer tarandus platyrhynchus TaxID=3082113 RepID=A0ACB0EV71_RANTA|nr:unnamed protein product [Rangifer tarandus platyrhynchus]
MGAGKASSPPHTLASALSPPGHACFIPLPVDQVFASPRSHHGAWCGLGAAVVPGSLNACQALSAGAAAAAQPALGVLVSGRRAERPLQLSL